jgi:predicted nucleic acid-binding protein
MSTLLDTNILLRTTQGTHPMHQLAEDAVAALLSQGKELHLVPQNLYKFWVVCTRPDAQNGLGMTAVETEAETARYKQQFRLLDDTPAILPEWERLVTQHQVLGKNAHDARLVAAKLMHSIARILTFNTQDFQRYPGIVVLAPQSVISGSVPPAPGTQGPVP